MIFSHNYRMYMHIRKANSKRIPLILKKIEMIEFYRYKSFEQNSTVNRINLLFLFSFLLSIIRTYALQRNSRVSHATSK